MESKHPAADDLDRQRLLTPEGDAFESQETTDDPEQEDPPAGPKGYPVPGSGSQDGGSESRSDAEGS